MLTLFRNKKQGYIGWLILYLFILKVALFFKTPTVISHSSDGLLYTSCVQSITSFSKNNQVAYTLIILCMQLLLALLVNSIVLQYKLLKQASNITAAIFLLITSLLPCFNYLSAPFIVCILLLLIVRLICDIGNTTKPLQVLFWVGILLGLSLFIYSYAILFIVLVFISILQFRAFVLREYVLVIVGTILPLVYYISGIYLSSGTHLIPYLVHFSLKLPSLFNSVLYNITLLLIGILTLMGLVLSQVQSVQMNIQARKIWGLLFVYFVIALLLFLCTYGEGVYSLWLLPASFFISCLLYNLPTKWGNSLAWLLLLLALFNMWY